MLQETSYSDDISVTCITTDKSVLKRLLYVCHKKYDIMDGPIYYSLSKIKEAPYFKIKIEKYTSKQNHTYYFSSDFVYLYIAVCLLGSYVKDKPFDIAELAIRDFSMDLRYSLENAKDHLNRYIKELNLIS